MNNEDMVKAISEIIYMNTSLEKREADKLANEIDNMLSDDFNNTLFEKTLSNLQECKIVLDKGVYQFLGDNEREAWGKLANLCAEIADEWIAS